MIVTPLDSAQLDSKEQYVFYYKMVDFAFKELIVAVNNERVCNEQEIVFFKQYCDLLLYSIEAMRVKYMYDEEDNMKIDLTDSGFPNYLEFRYLFNDLELRDQHIKKLPDLENLKEDFLDTLMKRKQNVSKRKLFEAASIAYYTSVKKQFIFNRFVQGKIIDTKNNPNADYLVSWCFYDVTHNRPFVCFMYFNYDGRDPRNERDEIYEALKNVSDRDMNMGSMAYAIDRKLENVFPKYIKRLDLGPLHNVFAKDENELTHTILNSVAKKEIPLESYALSLKIDEIYSEGEVRKGSFFSKQIFQKWNDPSTQNYVFAPHRIIQMLYNKVPDMMNNLEKPPIEIARLSK